MHGCCVAIGHAISPGRDSINLQDIPLVIKIALSTATRRGVEILDLLLRKNGELLTSDITNGLTVSEPTARRTMREFEALGIADISAVAGYVNTEPKMTLGSEYDWFKSKDFEQLRREEEVHICYGNEDGKINDIIAEQSLASSEEPDLLPSSSYGSNQMDNSKNNTAHMEACDNNNTCHTLKINSPPDTEHNNAICCDSQPNQQLPPQQQSQSNYDILRSDDPINSIYRYTNNNISNTDTCNQRIKNTYTIEHI